MSDKRRYTYNDGDGEWVVEYDGKTLTFLNGDFPARAMFSLLQWVYEKDIPAR